MLNDVIEVVVNDAAGVVINDPRSNKTIHGED